MRISAIAFRNIFRNGRRSLLSVIAIAVAAMAITFLFSLFEGISADIRTNAWNYETGQVRIRHTEYDRYEYLNPVHYVVEDYQQLITELRDYPGIAAVSPRIRVPSVHFRGERQIAAMGLGLDMTLEPEFQDLDSIVAAGRLPQPGSNEAIIGYRLAEELGVGIGDIVTFLTQTRQRGTNAYTVDVVGLANFPVGGLNQRVLVVPLDSAARYMRMHDAASEVLVKAEPSAQNDIAGRIDTLLGNLGRDELGAVHWTEVSGGYEYIRMANVVYRIIAAVFFLLAATVVISTTMMVIHERTREVGTLAALGMHDKQLVRLFFTEAAYLGAFGAALGVLIGIAIVIPLGTIGIDFGAAMDGVDMDMSSMLYPQLHWSSTIGVFVFSWVVTMAATFPSTRRAAKLRPVEALRAD
ncbi:ABC transporter permease [Spirochaeta africana]|uniref:ABC-type transport system, involved in lipoprotein release, permease component n=1 Tax=Spirochaeta africana (strain ATCC 700263 / DSM 8902 / Z-7692) TaxID=889378 RepID=H9UFI7_SPIAZ|nr:ABC transporter permease [Spirochaeta africana]AFG36280.1 ABC-type transport system, involved in lipoprotein release, permease component [Spirochaeta africana DSM 8902]